MSHHQPDCSQLASHQHHGVSNGVFSSLMFGAPTVLHIRYYEDHVASCLQWQQWWAGGLAMNASSVFVMNACSLTKAQKKTALKACGVNNAIVVGIIATTMADGDFKKHIGCATVGLVGAQALACFARAFRKDHVA